MQAQKWEKKLSIPIFQTSCISFQAAIQREAISLETHTTTAFQKHKPAFHQPKVKDHSYTIWCTFQVKVPEASLCVFRPIRSRSNWFGCIFKSLTSWVSRYCLFTAPFCSPPSFREAWHGLLQTAVERGSSTTDCVATLSSQTSFPQTVNMSLLRIY